MANGSKNSGNSIPKEVERIGYLTVVPAKTTVPKEVERIGYLTVVPAKTTVTVKGGGHGVGSYETKSRVSYGDKQSGSYGRETTKEKASAGEFQWKNGTSGTKCEYQKSSTVRFGDKSGYTEVYNERRVRNVNYNNGKDLIAYNNGGNDVEYGYGSGYDSDGYGCGYDSDY